MLNSLYIGKVIYDSDLLNEGDMVPQNRVKVFITGITPSVSEDFNHPRGITNENIMSTKTLDIAGQEFYAYVMMPVMGSGTGATYNANTDILTVSDTGNSKDLNACPPAEAYSHVHDGYIGGNSIGTAGVNVTANAYSPDNRSNSYKGMMALPSVGATVVVSFINNVRSMPVILGILPSVADVNSIHGVGFREEVFPNYPMAYSNLTSQSEETNPTVPDNETAANTNSSTSSQTTTLSGDTNITTTVTTKDGQIIVEPEDTPKKKEYVYIRVGNATVRQSADLTKEQQNQWANTIVRYQAIYEGNVRKLLAKKSFANEKEREEAIQREIDKGLKRRGITYD